MNADDNFYMCNDSDSGEDEDSVVDEFDVFFNDELADELYLLQFPLQACYRPFPTEPSRARIRPKGKNLEVFHNLNKREKHYDINASEERSIAKHCLRSAPLSEEHGNYALGVLRAGQTRKELHITPFNGVLKMRPSFSHIDKAKLQQAKALSALAEAEAAQDAPVMKDEKPQLVEVHNQRRETERMHNMRQNSYASIKQQEGNEPWKELGVVRDDTGDRRETAFLKLLYRSHERSHSPSSDFGESGNRTSTFTMDANMYIDNIAPHSVSVKTTHSSPSQQDGSEDIAALRERVKNAPVHQQVLEIFKAYGLVSFDQVCRWTGHNPSIVLENLRQYGLMIHGLWAAKSDVLYEASDGSDYITTPLARKRALRDLVLCQFHRNKPNSPTVLRPELQSVGKVSQQQIREICLTVAQQRIGKGWVLKLARDGAFIRKYDDIVAEQERNWDKLEREAIQRVLKPSAKNGHSGHNQAFSSGEILRGLEEGDSKASSKEAGNLRSGIKRLQTEGTSGIVGLSGASACAVLKNVYHIQGTSKLKADGARNALAELFAKNPEVVLGFKLS